MHGSRYVTSITNWEGCWLQSSLVHPHDENQEDAWSQNPMVHIHNNFFNRKRWTRARTSSLVTICLDRICSMLCNLRTSWQLLKQFFYMSRIRRKECPKTHSWIPRKSNQNYEILKSQQIGGVEQLLSRCWAHGLNSFLIPRHMLAVEF